MHPSGGIVFTPTKEERKMRELNNLCDEMIALRDEMRQELEELRNIKKSLLDERREQ